METIQWVVAEIQCSWQKLSGRMNRWTDAHHFKSLTLQHGTLTKLGLDGHQQKANRVILFMNLYLTIPICYCKRSASLRTFVMQMLSLERPVLIIIFLARQWAWYEIKQEFPCYSIAIGCQRAQELSWHICHWIQQAMNILPIKSLPWKKTSNQSNSWPLTQDTHTCADTHLHAQVHACTHMYTYRPTCTHPISKKRDVLFQSGLLTPFLQCASLTTNLKPKNCWSTLAENVCATGPNV